MLDPHDATRWLLTERSPASGSAPHVARIDSAGRHLPTTTRTTADVMASTRHRTRIDLERLTGIHERRVSDGEESSLSLAVGAATDALSRSRHAASELEVIINCSISKFHDGLVQQLEPTTSGAVARAIGAPQALTFDLNNACAGMLTGLFILNNWIRTGVVRRGMVVSGEYISSLTTNASRHVRHVLSRELASLTLGDAGAALVLDRAADGGPGIDLVGFTTVADHSRLCVAHSAALEPGPRMFTNARAIHQVAIADTPPLLQEALDAAGVAIDDVDWVIPHQTSARAIRKGMTDVAEALGATPSHDAVVTVDRYGNTASTTHTVALVEELQAGRIRAGDRIALIALASGLEIGVVLLTLDEGMVARHGNAA